MLTVIVVLNLLLTGALVAAAGYAYAKFIRHKEASPPAAQRLSATRPRSEEGIVRPIRHEPITGPKIAVTSNIEKGVTLGFYVPINEPNVEPFAALYHNGDHLNRSVPADSYWIVNHSGVIQGIDFRKLYKPAEDIAIVMETPMKNPASPRPYIITSREATPKLTEEEERKLAEEYGLVESPTNGAARV